MYAIIVRQRMYRTLTHARLNCSDELNAASTRPTIKSCDANLNWSFVDFHFPAIAIAIMIARTSFAIPVALYWLIMQITWTLIIIYFYLC